jgi:hypothetical protein
VLLCSGATEKEREKKDGWKRCVWHERQNTTEDVKGV